MALHSTEILWKEIPTKPYNKKRGKRMRNGKKVGI